MSNLASDAVTAGKHPIVLGDLNVDSKDEDSLSSLLTHPNLQDPFSGAPEAGGPVEPLLRLSGEHQPS